VKGSWEGLRCGEGPGCNEVQQGMQRGMRRLGELGSAEFLLQEGREEMEDGS